MPSTAQVTIKLTSEEFRIIRRELETLTQVFLTREIGMMTSASPDRTKMVQRKARLEVIILDRF